MRRSLRLLAAAAVPVIFWGTFSLTPIASGQSLAPSAAPEGRGNLTCTQSGDERDNELKGTPKRDVICAGAGNDFIRGLNGDDVLLGGPGNDTIHGGDGNDTLNGGKHNDTCRQGTGRGRRIKCDGETPDGDGGGGGGGGAPIRRCPVRKGLVYDGFGDDRGDHLHQGNDIIADKGEKVLATFPGTMENNNDPGGAGLYVKLTGKDGYTYGMHLDEFAKERKVKTGDVIGYVGSSGNAGGTNHLHFEWHPKSGDAVDPFPQLKKVCRNTARSPVSTTSLGPIY